MDNKNIVFVHIPRTGGRSIVNRLRNNKNIEFIGHDLRNPKYQWLRDYIKNKEKKFIFAFVRNPWDRAVSSFSHINQCAFDSSDNRDRIKYIKKYNNNFEVFVKDAFLNGEILNQIHFKPQYEWICDERGNMLADFVGKFENLQEDLRRVANMLNIGPTCRVPNFNKSEHGPYQEYYDEETKEIIRNVYKKDIELFGYNF